jgi:hypothetical protein
MRTWLRNWEVKCNSRNRTGRGHFKKNLMTDRDRFRRTRQMNSMNTRD